MIQRISKRFLSLLLVVVMVLALVPAISLPAFAAADVPVTGLTDETIGLKADMSDVWTANGRAITGSIKSIAGGGCDSDTAKTSKLVITNTRGVPVSLMFTYTYDLQGDGAAVSISGESSIASGNKVNRTLGAGDSIEVSITSGSADNATSISITSIQFIEDKNITTTFVVSENGSYSVNGETITVDIEKTQSSLTGYQLVAIPNDGYQFVGWYSKTDDSYFIGGQAATVYVPADCTVTAIFKPVGTTFEAGKYIFDDLGDAMNYAANNEVAQVTLLKDSSIAGSYTIPAGVTLLIPFDSEKTLYTSAPGFTTGSAKVFRTLTMEDNSSLCVNGAISVGGRLYSASGSASGYMAGDYGMIRMNANSSITVKSGGILYAWGFISGNGSVLAESGATVYEWYQITDFRGGTATTTMKNKVFPFSQYYVQNIETLLTLNAGAKEIVYTGLTAGGGNNTTAINFIGDDGMFQIISGSLSKIYDGSTDRIVYTVSGEAALNSLSLKLGGISVNSKNYVLPLTNNMTVNLASNSKLTINQNTALLAGVQANIASGAELLVADGTTVYIYDADEWIANAYTCKGKFCSVQYAPGKTYNRSEKDLTDVKVDINGTLTVAGAVYTTAGGANIGSSEGTGKYAQQNTPGTETITYQYTQIGSSVTAHEIPITPAKLHNADGSYTETETAKAGTTIKYYKTVNYGVWHEHEVVPVTTGAKAPTCTEPGCTGETICTACEKKVGSNMDIPALGHSWDEGVVEIEPTCTVTGVRKFTCKVCSESKTEVIRELGHDWGDWTVTTPATCTEKGKKTRTCTRCHETDMADIPATGHTKELRNEVKPTLTTPGYSGDEYCSVCQKLLKKGTVIPKTGATFTFDANGGEGEMEVQTSEKNTANPLNPNTFTRVGYTFDGWNTQADGQGTTYADGASVNFDKDTTLYAQWKINQYTITFDTDGGTSIAPITQDYGTSITKPADPIKTGYTFAGWESEIPGTMPAKDLTIKAKWTVNQYTVTWKNWDGTVLKTERLDYGATPTYSGTPEKPETARYRYEFAGWDKELVPVKEATTYTARFNEIGKDGLCIEGEDTYWIANGENVAFPGLIRINVGSDAEPHYHYYYFGEDGKAVKDGNYKVDKNNSLPLPAYQYCFDADGVIVHDDDTSKNGICPGDGSKYYYVDGVKVGEGLIRVDGAFYYARTSNGEIIRDRDYWIAKTNGYPFEARTYHFDADGKMVIDGFVDINGGAYYFVKGECAKGFTKIVDDYYMFNAANGRMYKDATMWVPANDYGVEPGLHYFDADGKMFVPDLENGVRKIVEENGKLYFTIDGVKMVSGLYELDGEYYFAWYEGALVTNDSVYVGTRLLSGNGWYGFDGDGRLIKTGFVTGDGKTYYYSDGVRAKGLTRIGDNYYFFNAGSGMMYKDATMWVPANDYGVEPGMHYFEADGKMFIPDTVNGKRAIVEEDGKLYFTIDGVKMVNGLYELDGEYYFAWYDGTLVTNGSAYVETSVLSGNGWYGFGADGKLIKTGFVTGGGKTYYYSDGMRMKGFTKIGDAYYFFNAGSGMMYKDATVWVPANDFGVEPGMYYFDADGELVQNAD